MSACVVLVDGIGRSGKSLLGPILASFERVEIERVEEIFEYIGGIYRMEKIERDAAVALLRMEADMHLCNSLIGRNTNFRFADHSSVWHTPNPWRYFRRLVSRNGDSTLRRAVEYRPIYQTMTHDQLANFPLLHAAFGPRLRLVEMIRHPVDIANSWLRRGWGVRFGEDPYALTLSLQVRDREVPYYALGWEEIYLTATPLGRIIRMIQHLWESMQQTLAALSPDQRTQVSCIPFEDFIQRPFPYVESLAAFLGTRPSRATRAAVKRERCPRAYRPDGHAQRLNRLKAQMTQEEELILERLSEAYEAFVRHVT